MSNKASKGISPNPASFRKLVPNGVIANSAETSSKQYSAISSITVNELSTSMCQLSSGAPKDEKHFGCSQPTYSESDDSESSIDDEIEIIDLHDTEFQTSGTEIPKSKPEPHDNDTNNLEVSLTPAVIDTSSNGIPGNPAAFSGELSSAQAQTLSAFPEDGKPYKCLVCPAAYSQKNILLVHLNSLFHMKQMSKLNYKLANNEQDNSVCQKEQLEEAGTENKSAELDKKPTAFASSTVEVLLSPSDSIPSLFKADAPVILESSAPQAVKFESRISALEPDGLNLPTFQTPPQLPTHQTTRLNCLQCEFQNKLTEYHQSKNKNPRIVKQYRSNNIPVTAKILILANFLLMFIVIPVGIFLNIEQNSQYVDAVEKPLPRLSSSTHDFISGYGSEKCIDISGSSYTDTAAAVIWRCDAAKESQQWAEGPTKHISGTPKNRIKYRALTARHSGKCLDVEYSETADNTPVIQYTCNVPVTRNQLFAKTTSSRRGYYQLKDLNSGKCVSVKASSPINGGTLVIYDCVDAPNQQWVDI